MAYVYSQTQNKLEPRGRCATFVGYAPTQKAWWFYLSDKWAIHTTVHAKFDDDHDARDSFSAEGEQHHTYDLLDDSRHLDDSGPDATDIQAPPTKERHVQAQGPLSQTPLDALNIQQPHKSTHITQET